MLLEVKNNNYYEDTGHMSVSRYKRFSKCELDGFLNSEFKSTAMLIGSYVDSFIEGTLDNFKEENPDIFLKSGKNKGELKADFQKADDICQFISNDKTFMQFMSGEKQTIMIGEISGVPFKIKMDSYSPHIAINDLKVMRSVTNDNGEYIDFITPWGYDIQLACYQEIVYQNTGEKLPCFICAVTKEDITNSVIVNIPQEFLDTALYQVQSNINHYYDIMIGNVEPIRCEKCKSCIATRKTTPIISLQQILEV